MTQEKVPDGWAGKQWMPQQYIHYRVTQPLYEELWARQDGKCPGCKQRLAHPWVKSLLMGLKPDTDHLHVKGRHCEARDVRGVLCHHCNGLLGKMRDNMDLLQGLLDYLKQHGDLRQDAEGSADAAEAPTAAAQAATLWDKYLAQKAARAVPTRARSIL